MSARPSFFKILLATILIFFLVLTFTSQNNAQQKPPITAVEEDLDKLFYQEAETINTILNLLSQIENAQREKMNLTAEISKVRDEISSLQGKINAEQLVYENNRNALKQVLKSYQKMGPASYLQIILESSSLGDFLRRLSIIRELSKNTYNLLHSINETRELLIAERNSYEEMLLELAEKEEQLAETLLKTIHLKEDMEKLLQSIGGQQEQLSRQLIDMRLSWNEIKPFFIQTLHDLASAIESGSLPEDGLKTTFTLRGIKGTISQTAFNDIIASHSELPDIEFKFLPGKVVMELPEKNLTLQGTFEVINKSAIMLNIVHGSFYGFPLDQNSLNELFMDTRLLMDFQPLIGSSAIQSIEIKDGSLELIIIPGFFFNQ
ncbi:coiled-coil domain-containing protein [Desulfitibacter alkalitolerans]|uniref:coiled-coil domain-containing protein n=1 Tax=Desulfitibacter alkalitolerans TaxID=264641 RepID=UPI00047F4886|nr:hypothetical protein [Desulfitibacter alkalitolerans]